ncbi:NUDIX domain-containing protein [Nocardiopsis sp. CC223A]|uniref:NUDIX domain-containing protein n=1 Tax=Nocardiopsis sp. CC223A TaxID=3044051 RepID=UPI00278C108E|nr:NUDIX domain-containing protein [Nocardiopsis sp. CC223A]
MTDPRPRGAVAVITNGRGEYLMHLRDDIPGIFWPGHWSLLGGGCEPGEAPAEAIVRELMEEVGLTLPGLTELCEVPDSLGSGQLVTAFAAVWTGTPRA